MKQMRWTGRIIRNAKMKHKLLASFILLAIIPMIVTGIFSANSSSRAIREKIHAYSRQLIRQVAYNIDANLLRIRAYSDDLIVSADIANRMYGYKDMDALSQSATRNFFFMKLQLGFINMQHIDDVMMVFMNRETDPPYDTIHVAMQYRWPREEIDRLIELNARPDNFQNFTLAVTPLGGTAKDAVVIGRRIAHIPTLDVLGHLLITVRQDFFNDITRDVAIGSGSHVFVLAEDGILITGEPPGQSIGQAFSEPALMEQILGNDGVDGLFTMDVGNGAQLISHSRIGMTDLHAVMMVPQAYLNAETAQFTYGIILLSLLILLMAVAAAVVIAQTVSAPLGRLASDMEQFGDGTLHQRAEVDREDEVGHLQRSFNGMADDIGSLMERIGEENRIRRMSELRVLEYQINPHFLYNTLDSINWMAQKAGQPDIGAMVTALARFYRLGLSKGKEFYTVQDELSHVTNYLIISKIRYKDCFEFKVDADPEVLGLKTLRILLQPLAENAIKHGVNKQRQDGFILIQACREGDTIKLSVQDNGKGIPQKELNRLNRDLSRHSDLSEGEEGFGLFNVNERIRLTYGEGFGVRLSQGKTGGLLATVSLPVWNRDCLNGVVGQEAKKTNGMSIL